MARMKLLLLVASVLALVAIVVWQNSPTATIPTPTVAVQLKPAVAPAASNAAAPVAASTEVPPAVVKNPAKTVSASKAPARVTRRDPPAVVTAEQRENAEPPSAREAKAPPARATSYEQRVNAAIKNADEDSDGAFAELQRLATGEPNRPEAYEAMAGISLRRKDYGQAREQFAAALAHGGKATFSIIHDHSRGNFDKADTKATCVGELTILADEVRFETPGEGDRFSATWSEVRETGSNKFFGSGIGGFHVTITAGGKYKNFNLAPDSKDKAEGKLILDVLASYTRRPDRTR